MIRTKNKVIPLRVEKRNNSTPELKHRKSLMVHTNSGIHVIQKSEIVFLKSDSNYCELFLRSGKKIFCAKTLKHFSNLLSNTTFFRVHNSYLVNLNFVTFVDCSYKKVRILDEFTIPIARSKLEKFKARLDKICD